MIADGRLCGDIVLNGTSARLPDLLRFASTHGLKIGTVEGLAHYRKAHHF